MAIENYLEMRDTVRDPQFHLQRALSLELERRFPQRFVPRYSMVMFHDEIPYGVALERGRIQNKILAQLTRNVSTLGAVDFQAAQRMIEERLSPIGP
jgi:kynurenine 3-monooxygenase